MLHAIGTRVRIVKGANHNGQTGIVVAGTMWTANENDPGDRVVKMDNTGERLVFEGYFLSPITATVTTVQHVAEVIKLYPRTIKVEQYAELVLNYGWDLSYMATEAVYGEAFRDTIDHAYANHIMGR